MTAAVRLARRLVRAELRLYWALARWVLRRPDVPDGATGFRHVGVVLPVLWTFIVLSAVEFVVLHLVLPWPTVRLVVDVLSAWGLLWMLGLTAALSVRTHVVDGAGLLVRNGLSTDVRVPWAAVSAVGVRRRQRQQSRALQLDRGEAGTVLNVVAGSQTNVDVTLREPLQLDLPGGRESVTGLRFYADDPAALVSAARGRLGAPEGER